MKYQPPYGTEPDGDEPYVNGDPTIAREGSIPPAAAIEYPQREIVHLIEKNDFVPSDGDLYQLTRAVRSQYVNFCTDTGSADALSVTLDPPLSGYKQGLVLRVLVGNTNTGATVINVNSLGDRPIVRTNGAELVAGDIVAGGIANLVDDGTSFQLVNFLGAIGGTENNFYFDIPYAEDSSVTPNTVLASFVPAITAPVAGDLILVKIANVNTGAVNITVNALAPLEIKRIDGESLQARDHIVDEVILLEYHSTYWQMMRLVRSQVYFKLDQNLTLYVRTDGNDNNDGSANDAAHAFLHIQAAVDYVARSWLIAGRTVTIQLGIPGTYTGMVSIDNLPGSIIIQGDTNNRTAYVISYGPTPGTSEPVIGIKGSGTDVVIQGVTINNTLGGTEGHNTVWVTYQASCYLNNVRFVSASSWHSAVNVSPSGSATLGEYIDVWSSHYVFLYVHSGGQVSIGTWFTLINFNSVTWTYSCVSTDALGIVAIDHNYCGMAGAAYGRRFTCVHNSVINTYGGGANYLPGNSPGIVDASSVYA